MARNLKKTFLICSSLLGVLAVAESAAAQIQNGESYVTCFPGVDGKKLDLTEAVSGIVDLRSPGTQPFQTAWTDYTGFIKQSSKALTPTDVGLVFGIAFDTDENVYVANSAAFGLHIVDSAGKTVPNGQAGASWMRGQFSDAHGEPAIYKVDTSTNTVSRFGSLTNDGPGFGNIAFNPYSSQSNFYVSDISNGKIYHLDANGSVQNLSGFDHGVSNGGAADNGLTVDINSPPFSSAANTTAQAQTRWGITQSDRLVWGVGVYKKSSDISPRLYYGVGIGTSARVFSVKLEPNGSISSTLGDIRDENINLSDIGSNQIITDLSFSQNGEMLLAERGGIRGGTLSNFLGVGRFYEPHKGRVRRFSDSGGVWNLTPNPEIGDHSPHQNSAGGVDFAYGLDWVSSSEGNQTNLDVCDARFNATADALHWPNPAIYGIQNSPIINSSNVRPQSYYIDLDNDTGSHSHDKTLYGDVEVYRETCSPVSEPVEWDCATIEGSGVCTASSLGGPNTHSVTLDITHDKLGSVSNNLPITDITITTDDGVTYPGLFTPNLFTPSLPLQWGQTTTATFDVRTQPGDEQVCLTIDFNKPDENALITPINAFCCTETICVDVPKCEGCLELQDDYLVSYSYLRNSIEIEGTICSDNISLSDLSIDVDGNAMTLTNVTPTNGGTCVAFEATFTGPTVPADDGLDTLFNFSASSEMDANGVSECCSDSLSIEYLEEGENIDNLDNNGPIIIDWPWDDIDWEIIEWGGPLLSPFDIGRFNRYLMEKDLIPENAKAILTGDEILVVSSDNIVRRRLTIPTTTLRKAIPSNR